MYTLRFSYKGNYAIFNTVCLVYFASHETTAFCRSWNPSSIHQYARSSRSFTNSQINCIISHPIPAYKLCPPTEPFLACENSKLSTNASYSTAASCGPKNGPIRNNTPTTADIPQSVPTSVLWTSSSLVLNHSSVRRVLLLLSWNRWEGSSQDN